MLKSELRREIRARKRQFIGEQLLEQSRKIVARLLEHSRLKSAKTVMLYCSLPDEVDTHELIDHLVAAGKRVVLPAVTGESKMELRLYTGKHDLRKGAFGIEEPVGKTFTDLSSIDLALVPGMAFDARGNRLGRGRGYYDRFLVGLKHTYKIGVCFDFQKVAVVPTDENDIAMDEVV